MYLRHASLLIIGSLLLTCLSAFGGAESDGQDQAIRQFDVKTIATLGRKIYEQDRYAARATDILFERTGGPDALKSDAIRGWVVEKEANDVTVRFIKEDGDDFVPVYDVRFTNGNDKDGMFVKTAGEKLSTEQVAHFKARQLALKGIPEFCSSRYNTVVLSDPYGSGLLVYALAATDNPKKIPVTGHYRFTVDETGENVIRMDRLFSRCMMGDKLPADEGKNVAAYYVTHVVSDTPLETHVFLSLLERKAFYVITRNADIWIVDGDSLRKVGNLKDKKSK